MLHIDDMALDFLSGDFSFVFRNVDVSWTEGQIVNVKSFDENSLRARVRAAAASGGIPL